MKKAFLRIVSLLTLITLAVSMTISAGAESALEIILRTGTTQAFTADAVPEEDIRKILQAGVTTSSAMNQQPWYFVAITNKDLMEELAAADTGSGSGPEMGGSMDGRGFPNQGMGDSQAGMGPFGGMGQMPGNMSGEMPTPPSNQTGGAGGATLGDSPLAIIVFMSVGRSRSSSQLLDCGLATQNMVIAASSLGYGVKIASSPAMNMNGDRHDAICAKLGVDTGMMAATVLLIGKAADTADAVSSASVRESVDSKSVIIR